MKEAIRAYILENHMYGQPPEDLDDEASFIETGIIDSTAVMELILFLEDEFDVKVEDEELLPENLDSVDKLCAFLRKKGVTDAAA